jgi:hypothetical protein
VPDGALAAPATATITPVAAPSGPSSAWPGSPAGIAWTIDLGGATLAKPVTIRVPYDPASLAAAADPSEVILAYADAAGGWTPVAATVDPKAGTVSASVSHLSTWAAFTIDWDYWLGFIGKAASGNLTDLLGAVETLASDCQTSLGGFTVDNSATRGLVKGCIQKASNGKATIGVTNLRLISFGLSGGALRTSWPVLDAGDTVSFEAGGKLAQPLVVGASLSPLVLAYQTTDLLVRLLPVGGLTDDPAYPELRRAVAKVVEKAWSETSVLAKMQKGDPAGAAEEAFKLMTGASFEGLIVKALVSEGQRLGVPVLARLTPERMNQVMLAANLAVLDATLINWDIQYFLSGYGEVRVTWAVPSSPARWASAGTAHVSRGVLDAVLLTNGSVLAVGNDDPWTLGPLPGSRTSEVWSPATGRWTATPDRDTAREGAALVALADGRALLVGGERQGAATPLRLATLYDPGANRWSAAAQMPGAMATPAAALLSDGRVLVAGVELPRGEMATEIYDPGSDRWTRGPDMPGAMGSLRDLRAVRLADGRALVVGVQMQNTGCRDACPTPGTFAAVLDPASGKWAMTRGRIEFVDGAVVPLGDGGALLVDGASYNDYSGGMPRDVFRLDPKTLTWAKTGSLVRGRQRSALCALADGRVLLVGGDLVETSGGDVLPGAHGEAEMYDPATGKWSRTAAPPSARNLGALVGLPDGSALYIGGTAGWTFEETIHDQPPVQYRPALRYFPPSP